MDTFLCEIKISTALSLLHQLPACMYELKNTQHFLQTNTKVCEIVSKETLENLVWPVHRGKKQACTVQNTKAKDSFI